MLLKVLGAIMWALEGVHAKTCFFTLKLPWALRSWALDDNDMDFGDINLDLLDEDDDVDVTEPVDNKQVNSQSQGDDLRQEVDCKKLT